MRDRSAGRIQHTLFADAPTPPEDSSRQPYIVREIRWGYRVRFQVVDLERDKVLSTWADREVADGVGLYLNMKNSHQSRPTKPEPYGRLGRRSEVGCLQQHPVHFPGDPERVGLPEQEHPDAHARRWLDPDARLSTSAFDVHVGPQAPV